MKNYGDPVERDTIPVEYSSSPVRPRILFDITTSMAWRGRRAVGIVRAERELARCLMDAPDLCVIPVIYYDGAFRAIESECAYKLISPAEPEKMAGAEAGATDTRGMGHGHGTSQNPFAVVGKSATSSVRALAHRAWSALPGRLRTRLRPAIVHLRRAFRGEVHEIGDTDGHAVLLDYDLDLSLVVYPASSDILFLCGLSWDVIDWTRIAVLREETGMRMVSMVYDLIPMKFPEFLCAPQGRYHNTFLGTIDNSDHIFCISAQTEEDLRDFMKSSQRPPVPTEVIHLGANIAEKPNPAAIVDPKMRARLAKGRFALVVGTVEVRKNYGLLLDLWEEMMADPGFDLDLVIVGMPGWSADTVLQRLTVLTSFGTRVLWLKDLSDGGLAWLYRRCHVFLYPSLYEGWGLPVVEALQQGRPIIASNRGAIPEATFGMATVLDPEDKAAWRVALLAEARAPRRCVTVPEEALSSWDKTAARIMERLKAILGQPSGTR